MFYYEILAVAGVLAGAALGYCVAKNRITWKVGAMFWVGLFAGAWALSRYELAPMDNSRDEFILDRWSEKRVGVMFYGGGR